MGFIQTAGELLNFHPHVHVPDLHPHWFRDDPHWNRVGAFIAARALRDELREAGLLERLVR